MKHRGDAVRDDLAVGIDERDIEREVDTRPRHHLALERVAVNIDNARQQHQALGVDRMRRAAIRADLGDDAVVRVNAGFSKLAAGQNFGPGNTNVHLPAQ